MPLFGPSIPPVLLAKIRDVILKADKNANNSFGVNNVKAILLSNILRKKENGRFEYLLNDRTITVQERTLDKIIKDQIDMIEENAFRFLYASIQNAIKQRGYNIFTDAIIDELVAQGVLLKEESGKFLSIPKNQNDKEEPPFISKETLHSKLLKMIVDRKLKLSGGGMKKITIGKKEYTLYVKIGDEYVTVSKAMKMAQKPKLKKRKA